jgi:hypothetical protein
MPAPSTIRDDEPATLRAVRRLALDVLQRTPSPAEQKSFTGAGVRSVAQRLVGSLEAMQAFVEEELYYFLLIDNFRPRTKAIDELPQRLFERKASAADALAEIVLSTGFSLRNPGNDTFVTVLLEQCLGLQVQDRRNKPLLEAGKQMYDGRRAKVLGVDGNSQADLVRIVLADPGATRHFLARHHQRIFGRPLPPKDGEAWVARVREQPLQFFPLLVEWLASAEYRAALATRRLRTDHQFIRSLHMDLLERLPTYDELRNMRNALQSMADPTPVRAVLAKVILDSGKAKLPACPAGGEAEFVRTCFLRYLGREPGQGEAAEFTRALTSGEAKPLQVVRTLVCSAEAEYQ